MSKCRIRLILWLILAIVTVGGGMVTDFVLKTDSFPLVLRVVGFVGILMVRFPLQRTGRLLRLMGEPEEWGCTSRLVTTDIYRCVRHPHHVGVGLFMTCLGLLIGHPWSFALITLPQWIWIIAFLFLVEEPELKDKFGPDYEAYCQKVPMLFGNPLCIVRSLSSSIKDG